MIHPIISASLSPNTEADDVWRAIRLLLAPWVWKRGTATGKVEGWFRKQFNSSCAVSFNSGRSAELAILKAFGIGRGSEVIVQAFTCVAVPNSVRWAGATPVYADIDATYNIDPEDFSRKITDRTRAVIVQHTFGIPANIREITAIAKKHNIRVFEDCAHALGVPGVGSSGDAAFFSFGRDKILSSVFGGLAIIHSKNELQCQKLREYHKKLNIPSYTWILQQILHPVAFSVILPLYLLGIGKALLIVLQRLQLLSFPVYREEKSGQQPADFPAKYPNALAILLLHQLKKLRRFSEQRSETVKYYGGEGPLLRFPKLVDDPARSIGEARKRGILIGNWYHNVIDPAGVDLAGVGYIKGNCPRAESAAKHIINLPTRIPLKYAMLVKNSL